MNPLIRTPWWRDLVHRVFRFLAPEAEKADLLLKDDVVSRQSVTVRDARSLGLPGTDRYVLVEGSETGAARAVDLLKGIAQPLDGVEADGVYRRFRAQDEEAASGMGFIFGP